MCFKLKLRAATSMTTARLRPGRTGRTICGTRTSMMVVYSSVRPRRSYSFFSFHSSRCITRSMDLLISTAPTPYMALISMIPMPRISIKWRIFSGDSPVRRPSVTRQTSTTSSATNWWPRLTSSRAASLLPTPLSPVISTPTPYTSSSTPWMVERGARERLR